MNRWKAARIHLAISLILAATIGALLYLLWFPSPYFVAAGANKLMLILMGVDVSIGPLLTLLVVNRNKASKALKLDLAVIAAVQAIAFAYGIHVIAEARPVFVVAAIDRFVLVTASEIADADLALGTQPEFRKRSWTGPVLVGLSPTKTFETTRIIDQALSGGKDIELLPRFYLPYRQVTDKLIRHARLLTQLKNVDIRQRRQLQRLQQDAKGATLLTLPLEHGNDDYTVIISPTTLQPIDVLPIDPW